MSYVCTKIVSEARNLKVTLIIPTLNEIAGMKEIMPRIKPDWYDQLIILDGGSTDGTVEYAQQQGYFLVRQKERGMRYAYMELLPYVEGDVIVTFSPDGNSVPELIPPLIEKINEGYDMVIVSRYARDAKSYDDDPITAFGNKMYNWLVNLFFRTKYTDVMVIFRAYRKELIKLLELDKDSGYSLGEALFRTRISWELLLSIRCAKKKLNIFEIPGDEPPRIGGERKLHVIRWGGAYLIQVLREVFVWR
jgi:glycosyltransferase involved in cell wall biosynthesis